MMAANLAQPFPLLGSPLLGDLSHWGGGAFGLLVLILDIIAIVSLLTGRASVTHKLLWVVVILVFPCAGVFLYFLFGRSELDA